MGIDHGPLFQEKDRKRLPNLETDYEADYEQSEIEHIAASEMAFVRPLKEVLPRLELLGFTLKRASLDYAMAVAQELEIDGSDFDADGPPKREVMSFEEFCSFACKHPVASLDKEMVNFELAVREERIKGRFANDLAVERVPYNTLYDSDAYSECSYFTGLVNILPPYSLLRVLAENDANQKSDVVWQYGPLTENGWAKADAFQPNARRRETFLIATEGSSDVHILKRALEIVRPDIVDFFRFIDVSERHPFSGTGSLVNFAEGLTKIDIQNQVVFLFDNDAEGYDACERVRKFSLPPNMRAMMLPELDEFRSFPAKGPNGITKADINQRAAAIECYLDLKFINDPSPHVVWTNYKKDRDVYQGALDKKEEHCKAFLQKAGPKIATGEYDVRKIKTVLDALVSECSAIAEVGLLQKA